MSIKKVVDAFGSALAPKYQCCFCGENIDPFALVGLEIDLGDKQFQSLSAHGMCLKMTLHSTVPFIAPEEVGEG